MEKLTGLCNLLTTLDLHETLRHLVQFATDRLPTLRGCGVWLRDGNEFKLATYEPGQANYPHRQFESNQIPDSLALFTDLAQHPFLNQDSRFRAAIVAPLKIEEQHIGYLDLYTDTTFSEADINALTPLLPYAAAALHNARLYHQEREQRRLNEALRETARLLNSTLDPDLIIKQILDSITRILQPETCSLMLVENGFTRTVDSRGFDKYGLEDWINRQRIKITEMPNFSRALATGQPIIIKDTLTSPDWILIQEDAWIRCHVDVSIQIDGRVIGFLNIDSATPGAFTEQDARWLQAFADQTAIAIRNARLYAAEHEQRILNEALSESAALLNSTLNLNEVFENILAIVGRVVPHDASNIMLVENGYTRTIGVRGYERFGTAEFVKNLRFVVDDIPDMQKVMETGQVSIIPDTREYPDWVGFPEVAWARSHLKAPILVENRVIGFLHLDSSTPNFFTEKHAHQIRGFTEQAALAIRNAQLFTAEHEQRILNEALNETATLLNSTLMLDDVFNTILKIVGKVVPHETSNIMLIEGDYTRTIGTQGYEKFGLDELVKNLRFKIDDMPDFKRARDYGEVRLIRDTQTHPTWKGLDEAPWIRSHLKTPIQVDGKTIGFISLDSSQPNFFTEKHAAWMRPFAQQAAIAIKNAQLFTAEREQRRLNEALLDITRTLNSTLELDQVIDSILANVGQVVPHEASNIMVVENGVTRTIGSRGFEKYGLKDWINSIRLVLDEYPDLKRNLLSGKARVFTDTHHAPDRVTFPETSWIRSSILMPIQLEGRLIGLLNLDSSQPDFFKEEQVTRIQAFVEQAAIAIRNAQLYTELDQERARLAAILDATSEGILYIEEMLIKYINQSFLQFTGFRTEEVLDHRVIEFVHMIPEEREKLRQQVVQELRQSGYFRRRDLLLRRKHDMPLEVDVTITVINRANPLRAVIVVRDISQEKQLQIRQNLFITHAAHELRHPLANFMTRLYLLRRKPQELEEHLARLDETTQRMTDILEDMLAVARFAQGQMPANPAPTPMQEVIEEVILENLPLISELNITIQKEMPVEPIYGLLDRKLFFELVSTLLGNAITYAGENSRIEIQLMQNTKYAVLEITDNGIPLPAEQLERFFDPFHRPSTGKILRTGLELTIAEYIVTQHHGSIYINSNKHGNTIAVKLPLSERIGQLGEASGENTGRTQN